MTCTLIRGVKDIAGNPVVRDVHVKFPASDQFIEEIDMLMTDPDDEQKKLTSALGIEDSLSKAMKRGVAEFPEIQSVTKVRSRDFVVVFGSPETSAP